MAHVVEVFGAPGTGKSSLARALDGRDVAGRRIVAAERLTRVPRTGILGWLRDRDLTPAERRAALAARADDWTELLAMAAAAPATLADDPLRALHATGWLAATLELRALADAAPDDVIVVHDEGLVQRTAVVCGPAPDDATLELRALADAAPDDVIVVHDEGLVQRTAVVCGPAPDDATLARYVRALPTTALHVHLREDPATLVGRLRGRDRIIDRHVGLDDEALLASVTDDAVLLERSAAALDEAGHAVLATTGGRGTGPVADDVVGTLRTLV